MILYYNDWFKPINRGVSVHYKTKNVSFLRFGKLLKFMGIKNHSFFLALHDKSIEDLDPHSPNLTREEKVKIANEVKINFWYFIREVVRVPPPAGNEIIRLEANRANISLYWLYFNHVTSMLLQPRQTGKSLSINILTAWLINTGSTNTDTAYLTKDDKLRNKTSVEIREIINRLPSYLKMLSKSDIKNSERVTVRNLNNVLNIYVGRTDKKAADNVGRGMTVPTAIIDEGGYVPNIGITLPILLAATVAARELSEKVGAPYGTIIATTPGKLNTPEGRFAYSLYNGSLRWSELFYDQENMESLTKLVSINSRNTEIDMVLLEFNHRQLGKTDRWLMKRMRAALSKGINAASDFLMKWVGGGSDSPIGKAELEIIKKSIDIKPRTEVTDYGYIIRWYVSKEKLSKMLSEGFLIAGMDTSDAIGKDGISIILRYSLTGEVVGAGDYNETNLTVYSDFVADLLIKYDNLVSIIERKSSGVVIIDNIITILHAKNINPFRKLFNWVFNDKEKFENTSAKDLFSSRTPDFKLMDKYRKYIGFATSGGGRTSRSGLYGNTFNSSIKYTGDKTRDSLLIHQLSSLIIKNGRVDHMVGEHDDAVVAWLLAYWFLTYGNNKSEYGLKNDSVLKDVVNLELLANSDTGDVKEIKQQEMLRNEINRLIKQLHKEINQHVAIRYLTKIKLLEKRVNYKIIKNFNLDSLLEEIKILKKLNLIKTNRG